jgi:hypothetical protein
VALREKPALAYTIADKLKGDALDITIRIAVDAPPRQAQAIMRSVWYAYRTLDGDNQFNYVPTRVEKEWPKLLQRVPGIKLNRDYVSVKEGAMLIQLPTQPLQKEYGLQAVDYRETKLPQIVTSGGLKIGVATYRGQTTDIYLPTSNLDELCLPHVVPGGMGCGKTMGFGANLAVEAVRHGMAAVMIDPAKGEMGDELEAVLKPEQIIRIRFGRELVALDWREASHSERSRNRMQNSNGNGLISGI